MKNFPFTLLGYFVTWLWPSSGHKFSCSLLERPKLKSHVFMKRKVALFRKPATQQDGGLVSQDHQPGAAQSERILKGNFMESVSCWLDIKKAICFQTALGIVCPYLWFPGDCRRNSETQKDLVRKQYVGRGSIYYLVSKWHELGFIRASNSLAGLKIKFS